MTQIEFIDNTISNNKIECQNNGKDILVSVSISSLDEIKILEELDAKSVLKEVKLNKKDCKISSLEIDNTYELYLSITFLRSVYKYFFFQTFDEFLNENRVKHNSEIFYIKSINYSSISKEQEHELIIGYSKVSQLLNIIKHISLDENKEGKSDYKYTIFDKRKITIHSKYEEKDIEAFTAIENLDEIIATFMDEIITDSDKRVNRIFLVNAIEDSLEREEKEPTLVDIFKVLSKIYNEYQIHHRAYINSLDPAKLKDDANKSLKEYFSKLNTLLSDVNSKIIFLPIAFIVSLGQMTFDTQAKNIIITLGMFIFCLIMHKFSKTQENILNAIEDEIISKKEECKEVNEVYKSVEKTLSRLNKLTTSVSDRFVWTIRLNWAIFAIVIIALIYYSNCIWSDKVTINKQQLDKKICIKNAQKTNSQFDEKAFTTLQ